MSINEQWSSNLLNDMFNIDVYLAQNSETINLSGLQYTLKNVFSDFQHQMLDILRCHSDQIIDLSKSLYKINIKINSLSGPITEGSHDIMMLFAYIKDIEQYVRALTSIAEKCNDECEQFTVRHSIPNSIKSLLMPKPLKPLDLQQLVFIYVYYYYRINLPQSSELSIANEILNMTNHCFLTAIDTNCYESIVISFGCFIELHSIHVAERLYSENFVQPKLSRILTEANLKNNKQGLNNLYKQVLSVLDSDVVKLTEIAESYYPGRFDFIRRSFWSVVYTQFKYNLQRFTSPNDMLKFQRSYKAAKSFLEEIADRFLKVNKCECIESTFQEYLNQYNLNVYFEVVFQQVACVMERGIQSNSFDAPANSSRFPCKLLLTSLMLDAMKYCLQEIIFIEELSTKYLRLLVHICVRYLRTFSGKSDVHLGLQNVHNTIGFLAVLTDLHTLLNHWPTICQLVTQTSVDLLLRAMRICRPRIFKLYNCFLDSLVSRYFRSCEVELQHVNEIPRLFRRTNRNVRIEGSSYINDALHPIKELQSKHTEYQVVVTDILNHVIPMLVKRHLQLATDVLTSVSSIERSLKMLKARSNENYHTMQMNTGTSDVLKMRKQIEIDLQHFISQITPDGMTKFESEFNSFKAHANNKILQD